MTLWTILSYCFLGATVIAVSYQLTAFVLALRFLRRDRPLGGKGATPAVSIFKPVHGTDADLYRNLASFCQQRYPAYEVLLAIAEPDDPSRAVLEKLAAEYPHVSIVLGETKGGANRKVNSLCAMARQAKHGIWIISDSDMCVEADYLTTVAHPFHDPKVGLVTCLYQSVGGRSLGAALESLTINLDFFPSVVVASHLEGISFALGATMAVRKEAAAAIGGLETLAPYLADDYQLGNQIFRAGYRLVLSPYVVQSVNTIPSFSDYVSHQLRWARTYRICRPGGYFGYGITQALSLSLLYGLCAPTPALGMAVIGTTLLLRLITGAILLGWGMKQRSQLGRILWLPLKDVLSSVIWLSAFLGNEVSWKQCRFRVHRDGTMTEVME